MTDKEFLKSVLKFVSNKNTKCCIINDDDYDNIPPESKDILRKIDKRVVAFLDNLKCVIETHLCGE